ncbi:MAG: phytase [Bacteroidota bacterium]
MRYPLLVALVLLVGCADTSSDSPNTSAEPVPVADSLVVVPEAYVTVRDTAANVDSPAIWHGPDGQHWLLVTAKESDVLQVFNAATGDSLRAVGGSGSALGQLERPNGVAVWGNLALVVERDNRRVQAFSMPEFESVGSFGQDVLRYPYGIAVQPLGDGRARIFVTDDYQDADESVPVDSLLGERVHRFEVTLDPFEATHASAFGETGGDGVLHVVESILADPTHDRLFIAEEEEGASMVMVYDSTYRFTGERLPTEYFATQAEGLALAGCADGSGLLVATDQDDARSAFHVFDRATLAHRGSFVGETTANTDGIALTQVAFGPFERGAFFAVDDDGATAAFDWGMIVDALGLASCGEL